MSLSWSLKAVRFGVPLRDVIWWCSPLLSILRSVILEVFNRGEPVPHWGSDASLNSIVLVPVTTKSPVWTPRAELPVPCWKEWFESPIADQVPGLNDTTIWLSSKAGPGIPIIVIEESPSGNVVSAPDAIARNDAKVPSVLLMVLWPLETT